MLPAKDLLIVFNKVVDSVFELIFSLEKQNAKLIEARDILLPRLMSGQIEV
jgi:type I restriction enzyme S subunit